MANRHRAPDPDDQPTFTCPACDTLNRAADDVANGYCGRCHWFTGDPLLAASRPELFFEHDRAPPPDPMRIGETDDAIDVDALYEHGATARTVNALHRNDIHWIHALQGLLKRYDPAPFRRILPFKVHGLGPTLLSNAQDALNAFLAATATPTPPKDHNGLDEADQ